LSTASDRLVPKDVRGEGRQTIPANYLASIQTVGTAGTGRNGRGSPAILQQGYISRRMERDFGYGIANQPGLGRFQIQQLALSHPTRLLTHLPSLSPQAGYSILQNLCLIIPEDGLAIVATDAKKEQSQVGTDAVEALWSSLPDEIGGLVGLETTQAYVGMLTGVTAVEGVPARRLEGLSRVWPTDPLTLMFKRLAKDADMTVYQRQAALGISSQIQELRSTTFFWNSWQKWVDDPWGMPYYNSTALAELLVDLAFVQDMRDAVHNNAWQRYGVPFNWENVYRIARDVFHITDINKAKEFANEQFNEVKKKLQEAQSDEAFLYDSSNGDVHTLTGANYQGVDPVIKFFQWRLGLACKDLPTMMGLADNASESFSTISWLIKAKAVEKLRTFVMKPIVQIAQLHLDLLGIPLKAVAKYERLRTSDALIDAQTRSIEIQNELLLWENGLQSQDEVAVKLTGSGPVKQMDTPASTGNPNGNPAQDVGKAGQNPSGEDSQDQKSRTGKRQAMLQHYTRYLDSLGM
jgi:hypothetical protein